MRKILILIILLLSCSVLIYAQAPQGLNYQAVAYNASGVAVTNQLLGVRLSILDGSATGTLVYQETQNPTTDNTGLFSIVIGNGTVVSGAFNTINWGNGSKWLKTEIDITGGTNYVVIGTSQFMSVPYSLYANAAGVGTATFSVPDGFVHSTMLVLPDSINYTVPAGKNLYIPTAMGLFVIDGDTITTFVFSPSADPKNFVGASEGSVVWGGYYARVCFLVDKLVDWKTMNIANTTFTVPANKKFVIVNSSLLYTNPLPPGTPIPAGCSITLNGTPYSPINGIMLMNSILDEGTVLSSTGCTAPGFNFIVNGYLKDK